MSRSRGSTRTAIATGIVLLLLATFSNLSAQVFSIEALPQNQQISVIDFSQCANDPAPSTSTACPGGWINGILQANNSHYIEDQSVPQRFVWSVPNAPGAPLTGRTITIVYEARKADIHAYDSLATWNYTQTSADRCQGLAAADCPTTPFSQLSVPDDPTIVNDTQPLDGTATSLHQLPGQFLTMYGGTITHISVPVHDAASAESTDDYATVVVTYSVSSLPAKVMLLLGGHTAPGLGTRGWGVGYGSAMVSGGPYHFKWEAADGTSVGRRDNQIMGGAFVCVPPVVSIEAPSVITCTTQQVTLTGHSTPAGATYLWTTSDGNIVSGADTLTPVVDKAGTYTFTSTIYEGCSASTEVTVTEDKQVPTVSAGSDKVINCNTADGQLTLTATSDPAGTYLWTTTDGNIVSGSTSLSVVVDQAGTYTFTSTLTNGCSASDTASVTVDTSPPVVNAGEDKVIDCNSENGQVTLTATSDPGGTYLWSTTNGHFVSTDLTQLSVIVDQAGDYTFTSTLTNGCNANDVATVTANTAPPVVSAGEDKVINCNSENGQVTLTATSAPGGTYLWSTTNGHFVSTDLTQLSVVVDQAGDYTFTSTLGSGCNASDVATVTVDTAPPVVAAEGATLNCSITEVSISGSSSVEGTYLWTGPGIVSGANTLSPVVNQPGLYTLTVTTANGCSASANATVTQDIAPPEVDATGGLLNCSITEVTLTGFTSVEGTYLWTGPGIVSGGNTLNPIVNQPGIYTLTVTAPNGCSASAEAIVDQDIAPPVVAANGGTLTCAITELTLSGSSSVEGTYLWSGPGIVSGGNTLNPIVNQPGIYTLTVTAPNGCSASAEAIVSEDTAPPEVSAGNDAVINCNSPEGQVTLTASYTPPPAPLSAKGLAPAGPYLWTTTNGHIVSGETTLNVVVDAAGTYTFTATAPNGCQASDSADVTLDTTPPVVSAGNDKVIDCNTPEGQVTLNATSDPAGTYLWSTTDGHFVSTDLTGLSVIVDKAGTYTFSSTTANGCEANDTAVVTEDKTPPTVNAGDDKIIDCNTPEGQVTLNATSDPAGTYLWSTTDGHFVSTDLTGLSVIVDKAGTYTFTSKTANGCDASDTAVVTEDKTPPTVSAGEDKIIDCNTPEGQVTLNATSDPTGTYLWSTTDGHFVSADLTGLSVIVDKAGTYTFTSTTSNGCDASDTAVVTEDTNVPTVNAGDDKVIDCNTPEGQVTLNATSDPAGTYLWSTTDGHFVSADLTGLSVIVDKAGTYTFTSTTSNGCDASDSAVVTEDKTPPTVNAGDDKTIDCNTPDGQITLTATSDPAGTYLWSTTNGHFVSTDLTGNSVIVDKAGDYTFTSTTANGCEASDTATVTEDKTPPTVNAGEDTQITCESPDGQVTLTATSVPAGTYLWSTANGHFVSTDLTGLSVIVDAPGTYTFTSTAANGCDASDDVIVTVEPCDEYCTLTQGWYGNAGGSLHYYNGQLLGTSALVQALLSGSPMVLGLPGRSLTIAMADSECIVMRLPANGSATYLPAGDNQITMSSCGSTIPNLVTRKTGKFNNVLLGQTIALDLNLRLDPALAEFDLCHAITTRDALAGPDGIVGTPDDIPDPDPGPDGIYNTADDTTTVIIPNTVLTALGSDTSVEALLALANQALGGTTILHGMTGDISSAVGSVNVGFDECAFLVDCSAEATLFAQVAANETLRQLPLCESIGLSAETLNQAEEMVLTTPREVFDALDANGLPHNLGGLLELELRANRNAMSGGFSTTVIEETSKAISRALDANATWRCINQ